MKLLVCLQCLLFLRHIVAQAVVDYRKSVACIRDCVCNAHILIGDIDEALSTSERFYNPNVLEDRVLAVGCREYVTLPSYFELLLEDNSGSLKELRHRYKRSFNHYYGDPSLYKQASLRKPKRNRRQGSSVKEESMGAPAGEQLSKYLLHVPTDSSHLFIPVGGKAVLNCHSSGKETLYAGGRSYFWEHSDGLPITAPLTVINEKTGDLTFASVRLADTGLYNCTVKFDELDEADVLKTFQTRLDVVSVPMLWLHFEVSYRTDRCRHAHNVLIQEGIKGWIHQYACHFCEVKNLTVSCDDKGPGGDSVANYKVVQIVVSLNSYGVEPYLQLQRYRAEYCTVSCIEAIHAKVLTIVSESLQSLFLRPIQIVSQKSGQTFTYSSLEKSQSSKLESGCLSGFHHNEKYNLCCMSIPCGPGKFSPHGKSVCYPCRPGTFQGNIASTACHPCPDGKTTKKGAHTDRDCVEDGFFSSIFRAMRSTDELMLFYHENPTLSWGIIGGLGGLILLCVLGCLICIFWTRLRSLFGRKDNGKDRDGAREKLIRKRDREYRDPDRDDES